MENQPLKNQIHQIPNIKEPGSDFYSKMFDEFTALLDSKTMSDCIDREKKSSYNRMLTNVQLGLLSREKMPQSYKDVQLTEAEKYNAILPAYNAQKSKIATRDYFQRIENNKPKVWQPTFGEYYDYAIRKANQIIKQREPNRDYEIDDDNRQIFYSLAAYFSGDAEALKKSKDFEGKPLQPHKGILLFGPYGPGKTVLGRIFANNPFCSYKLFTCEDMAKSFAVGGFDAIQPYTREFIGVQNAFGCFEYGILFDDLGAELGKNGLVANYKNEINVMEKILRIRYDTLPFNKTFTTTNLNRDQIGDYYGPGVLDRFHQMYNFIAFSTKAKSRRK